MTLYNFIFYLHLASLSAAVCGILYADRAGLQWMRGSRRTLEPQTLRVLHAVMSLTLCALILTGLYLFWPVRQYLLHQPRFLLKLLFIACLVLNSLVIDRLMGVAATLPYAELSGKGKAVLGVSGAVSALCWAGAALMAVLQFGLSPFGL